jgi:ribosomal protein S18 acetylase RimI-like enzyme
MRIKKLSEKDFQKIYEFGKKEFGDEHWYCKRFIKDTLRRKQGIKFGCYDKGRLAGAMLTEIYDPPKAWIYFFLVEKGERGKGIGTKLLNATMEAIPKENPFIIVDFEKRDKSARKFYKKHGFKKQARIKYWFGKGHPGLIYACLMEKK